MYRILQTPTPLDTPYGSHKERTPTPFGISPRQRRSQSYGSTPREGHSMPFGTSPTERHSSTSYRISPNQKQTISHGTSPTEGHVAKPHGTSPLTVQQNELSTSQTKLSDVYQTHAEDEEYPPQVQINSVTNSVASIPEETTETEKEVETRNEGVCGQFSRRQIFTILVLAMSNICSAMFGSLLAPFFPTEAQDKGVSQTWIGLIFGSFQLFSFLISPVWGAYLTKIGAKFMYVAGIFVNSGCAILFGFLQWCPPGTIYIIMCFSTRSLESLGSAAIGTASRAIASHSFPQHISSTMGILSACSCIGLMAGPPLGGILFEAGGFYLPFLATGTGFMLCGLVSACFLPRPPDDEPEITQTQKTKKWHLVKLPIISVIGYIVFVGQLAMGFIDVTFTIHLKDVAPSLSPGYIGLIFLIAPVVVVIFSPIFGWIADKVNVLSRPVIILGVVLAGAGFLGLGPAPFLKFIPPYKLWIVLTSLSIAGIGWAALVITYNEFVLATRRNGFPDTLETQGMISGVYNAYGSCGAFLGPVVGGVLNEHLGFGWTSTIIAFMILLSAIILVIYMSLEMCFSTTTKQDVDSAQPIEASTQGNVQDNDEITVVSDKQPLLNDSLLEGNIQDNNDIIDQENQTFPNTNSKRIATD